MKKSLEEDGAKIYMTRNSGTRLNVKNLNLDDEKQVDVKDELVARANYINSIPSDFTLIIHNNAYFPSKVIKETEWNGANGTEIYFFGIKNLKQLKDKKLNYNEPKDCKIYSESSKLVAEKLGQYLSEQEIKVSVLGSDMKDLELNSNKTILLIELRYMTNKSNFNDIKNIQWQNKIINLLTSFSNDNIDYIKKVNHDYALKKNLYYITAPKKDSSNLEKMMNKDYWRI